VVRKIRLSKKASFKLELLDNQEKQSDDNPSIGIILCPRKDDIEVEFSLRTSNKPIGVAEYKLTRKLPENLKGKVPTSKELKQMLIWDNEHQLDVIYIDSIAQYTTSDQYFEKRISLSRK